MIRTTATLFLLSVPSLSLAAATVDDSHAAATDGLVTVELICGELTVTGWDNPQLRVTGTLDDSDNELEIVRSGSRIDISLEKGKSGDVDCAHLQVYVPSASKLRLEAVSADVRTAATSGPLEIETVSGDVLVEGAPSEAEIETVSGTVDLIGAAREVDTESVSGMLNLRGAQGRVEAESVSGDVIVQGGPFEKLEVQTVSGDIRVAGSYQQTAQVELASHSGDVELALPENVEGSFAVSTFSGRIEGDLAGRRVSGFGPGTTMQLVQGSADASFKVVTHSGDVELNTK